MPRPRLRIGTLAPLLAVALVGTTAAAPAVAETSPLLRNTAPITIPAKGTAGLYPSPIAVNGMPGVITDVVVGLRGLSHGFPSDIDALLVAPDGRASIVMSDACGGAAVADADWIFGRGLVTPFPELGFICDGGLGLHRVTDRESTVDVWPGAPAGPHPADLDRLVGGDPNGDWRLYVLDDRTNTSGTIADGWTLSVESQVPDALIPASTSTPVATPYPMTRTISGIDGVITDLDVTLPGVHHARPRDLVLILVGPQGERVKLMANACGESAVVDATWTWDDEAADGMPAAGPCQGTLRSRVSSADPYVAPPAPAPPRPYDAFLSTFDNTDPEGEWRLFAFDTQPADGNGFVLDRFSLSVTTRPRARVGFVVADAEVSEGERIEIPVFRSSGGAGLGPGSLEVTAAALGASPGTDYAAPPARIEFTTAARGGQATSATIPFDAVADALPEGTESVRLTLAGGTGDARPEPGRESVVVSIRDVPPPAAGPTGPPAGEGSAGGPGTGGSGTAQGGAGPVDRIRPVVRSLAVRPARLRTGRRATARFGLSEPSAVTLTVARIVAARRRGTTRPVTVGRLTRTGVAGSNVVRLSPGPVGRRLRPGAYRLTVAAVDAEGNRSVVRARRFRVVS